MKSTGPGSQNVERLPYVKPLLKTYGSVAAITNAADMIGAKDGGGGANNRT